MISFILFALLFLLITLGVPVGFALGGATIAAMALFTNLDLSLVAAYAVSGIDSLPMMAIPFFIMSGVIMSVGGLARRLVDVAASMVGWMMGGLGAVVSLASMFFGAISGSSMATVSCIGSFAALLSFEQVTAALTAAITPFTDNKYVFLMLVNIVLLLIGCVIDNIPATTILAPMLLPAMTAFGVDPVTFGVFMTINLLIGLVTPPYGCSLFVASAVCGVKMEEMLKNIAVPLITLIICLLLTTYIPWLTIWFK